MRPFLLVLLVLFAVWIAVSVIGFRVKSLFWLSVVALLLALGTAVLGASKRR